MQARPSAPGWCPSIGAVVRQRWWPGRLIFDGQPFVDGEGVERTRLTALCPFCGKWVPVRAGDLIGHEQPKRISDAKRIEKAEAAEREYRELTVQDALFAARVA